MSSEAAERLREWIRATMKEWAAEHTMLDALEEALAAERKATVERIRAAAATAAERHYLRRLPLGPLNAILDAEADR